MERFVSVGQRSVRDNCIVPYCGKKFYAQFDNTLRAFRIIKTEIRWKGDEVIQLIWFDIAGLGIYTTGRASRTCYFNIQKGDKFFKFNFANVYASVEDFKHGIATKPYYEGNVSILYAEAGIKPLKQVNCMGREAYFFKAYKWDGCKVVRVELHMPSLIIDKNGIYFDLDLFWKNNKGIYFDKTECLAENEINVVDFDDDCEDFNDGTTINVLGKEYLVKTNIAMIKQCATMLEGLLD